MFALFIEGEPPRSGFPALWLELGFYLAGADVDRQREILILVVRVKNTANGVDGVAFRLSLQRQLRLHGGVWARNIQDDQGLVSRRGDPDFLGGGHVEDSIWDRLELDAWPAAQAFCIDRADGRIGAVANIDNSRAHGGRSGSDCPGPPLPNRKALHGVDFPRAGLDHVYLAGVARRHPESARRKINREVIHQNG